jgi:quercetin dioxygenase-like cupin family protein
MEHYTWKEMDKEVLSRTIARRIIAGEKAMVAQVFLVKGAVVPEHKHESEQITYILEGALLFEIDGKEILVGKGQVLRIPSWKPHKATALEDTLDLDIFSPIREDWLKNDDAYLRQGQRAIAQGGTSSPGQ